MRKRNLAPMLFIMLAALLAFAGGLSAFDFTSVENKVSEIHLDNGLTVLVMEDHSAPVVSFALQVDVGSVNDPKGYTGMAHVFEHMAFKGTTEVGTKDWNKEKKALDALDNAFRAWRAEMDKGDAADETKLDALKEKFTSLQAAADSLVEPNEVGTIIDQEGGVGLNAGTGDDHTTYYVSFPSNKVELWFALESSRFSDPVLRQFYKEVNVVKEERRMSNENSAQGKLVEEFLAMSYRAHPYGISIVGHMSDLNNMDKDAAMKFYKTYYVPSNMVISIVGDVKRDDIKKLAEKYFGNLPGVPKPRPLATVEPEQYGERRLVIEDPAQPLLLVGFHRPEGTHPDSPVFEALADYLGSGRTSLLHKDLVKDKKMATAAIAFGSFPGDKYPNQFGVYVLPAKGYSAQDCEDEVYNLIDKLKNEPIPEAELEKIKARAKATLINQLASRSGMAYLLAAYQTANGDWRELFNFLNKINAVTAEDCQRVAKEYFTTNNRTVGIIKTVEG